MKKAIKNPKQIVSRILSWTAIYLPPSVRGTAYAVRSTRESDETGSLFSPIWPRSGRGLPSRSDCSERGGLLLHLFTLAPDSAYIAKPLQIRGGLFSVALSFIRVPKNKNRMTRLAASVLPCGVRTFLIPSTRDAAAFPCFGYLYILIVMGIRSRKTINQSIIA